MNNIIACQTVTGVSDSLESVNHIDIFGDSTNVPVRAGDICFVIDSALNTSYMYVARDHYSPATSGTSTVAMTSGGTIQWERQLIADKNAADELPSNYIHYATDGTVPSGYDFIFKIDDYSECTGASAFEAAHMIIYDGFVYRMFKYDVGEDAEKYEISTGITTALTSIPLSVNLPAAAYYSDKWYVFNTYNADALALDLTNDTWSSTFAQSIPGTTNRIKAMACYGGNSKIYLAGGRVGTGAFLTEIHEYDPVGDSYTSKTAAPIGLAEGKGVLIGDKIHFVFVLADSSSLRSLIYDVTNNTWDDTTVDSVDIDSAMAFNPVWNGVYYDSVLDRVCVALVNDVYRSLRVIGYDPDVGTWEELWHTGFNIYNVKIALEKDTTSGRIYMSQEDPPYLVSINPLGKNMCIKS